MIEGQSEKNGSAILAMKHLPPNNLRQYPFIQFFKITGENREELTNTIEELLMGLRTYCSSACEEF